MTEQNTEIQNDDSSTKETDIINNKNNKNQIQSQQSFKKSLCINKINKSYGLAQRKMQYHQRNSIFMQMSHNYYSGGKLSGLYKRPFQLSGGKSSNLGFLKRFTQSASNHWKRQKLRTFREDDGKLSPDQIVEGSLLDSESQHDASSSKSDVNNDQMSAELSDTFSQDAQQMIDDINNQNQILRNKQTNEDGKESPDIHPSKRQLQIQRPNYRVIRYKKRWVKGARQIIKKDMPFKIYHDKQLQWPVYSHIIQSENKIMPTTGLRKKRICLEQDYQSDREVVAKAKQKLKRELKIAIDFEISKKQKYEQDD